MATKTLCENINQAINDFNDIKQAIISKGQEVPDGTDTSQYDDIILEIETGGGGGKGIDTSAVTNFKNFCRRNRLLDQIKNIDTSSGTDFSYMFWESTELETLPKLDTSNGTNFYYMFDGCNALTTVPQLDTSNGTNFSRMFCNCSALATFPELDTSKGTNFSYMVASCIALTTIPELDTSSGTDFSYMFQNCRSVETIKLTSFKSGTNMFSSCLELKNLIISGTITVQNNYFNLSNSSKLTADSLLNVLNALADNTGGTTYKITLGSTNLAKLTDEQKAIATNKNYTLA